MIGGVELTAVDVRAAVDVYDFQLTNIVGRGLRRLVSPARGCGLDAFGLFLEGDKGSIFVYWLLMTVPSALHRHRCASPCPESGTHATSWSISREVR